MRGVFSVPSELEPLQHWVFSGLERVSDTIAEALASDIPAVAALCKHVERYRGKMLRPTLTLLSGAACGAETHRDPVLPLVTVAAVTEMVHMATLVHDDVLDEADVRRGGQTVNASRGNETAVILGDYLIAASYALCSQLDDPEPSRIIGRVSMDLCAGELLQLDNRDNHSLDEPTYYAILEGKTASLVGACCRLGARAVGADDDRIHALHTYGRRVGVAFQLQDDVLDLTGDESRVGKSLGRDLAKGKLTLPFIHHLAETAPSDRGRAIETLLAASETSSEAFNRTSIPDVLGQTRSVDYTAHEARRLIAEAKTALQSLDPSFARQTLEILADAVLERDR